MSSSVIVRSRAELELERDELLESLPMSFDELKELAGEWELRASERRKYERIRTINYLLDNDG